MRYTPRLSEELCTLRTVFYCKPQMRLCWLASRPSMPSLRNWLANRNSMSAMRKHPKKHRQIKTTPRYGGCSRHMHIVGQARMHCGADSESSQLPDSNRPDRAGQRVISAARFGQAGQGRTASDLSCPIPTGHARKVSPAISSHSWELQSSCFHEPSNSSCEK